MLHPERNSQDPLSLVGTQGERLGRNCESGGSTCNGLAGGLVTTSTAPATLSAGNSNMGLHRGRGRGVI